MQYFKLCSRLALTMRDLIKIHAELTMLQIKMSKEHTVCPSQQDIVEAKIELGLELDPELVVADPE
jgi:dihydroneopterin aldolase